MEEIFDFDQDVRKTFRQASIATLIILSLFFESSLLYSIARLISEYIFWEKKINLAFVECQKRKSFYVLYLRRVPKNKVLLRFMFTCQFFNNIDF